MSPDRAANPCRALAEIRRSAISVRRSGDSSIAHASPPVVRQFNRRASPKCQRPNPGLLQEARELVEAGSTASKTISAKTVPLIGTEPGIKQFAAGKLMTEPMLYEVQSSTRALAGNIRRPSSSPAASPHRARWSSPRSGTPGYLNACAPRWLTFLTASAKARATGSRISGPVVLTSSAGVWKKRCSPAMPKKFG